MSIPLLFAPFAVRLTHIQVPTIWLLYTVSYLDRANIGNAKSGGMEESLHLTSTEYSVILLVFFVSRWLYITLFILTSQATLLA